MIEELEEYIKLKNSYNPLHYPANKKIPAEEWNALWISTMYQGNHQEDMLAYILNDILPVNINNINDLISKYDNNYNIATEALNNSETALSNSIEALDTANGIDAKASTALSNSATALNNSEEALQYTDLKVDKVAGKALSTNDLTNTLKSNYDAAYSHSQIVDSSNPHATTFANLESKPTTISGYGITDALNSSLKGANNGLAELDAIGKVPTAQLPSYVDDVIEVANYASLPVTGEDGKIYVTLDTNLTYRWGGTAYVEISPSLALGETSSTAYRGDLGKIAYDHSQLTSGNPHNVTKSNVGLSNVYNPTAYGGISYGGGASESGISFTDLNSLTFTGFYTCYGTTANVPSASYSWFIQHINSNVGNVSATQTAIAYGTTNIIYKRNKSSSTWSAWENISPSLKENLTNKVTSISSSSTDTQYPSAKCVYDIVGDIESLLAEV